MHFHFNVNPGIVFLSQTAVNVVSVAEQNFSKGFSSDLVDNINEWAFRQFVHTIGVFRNQYGLDNAYRLRYDYLESDGWKIVRPSEELNKLCTLVQVNCQGWLRHE